MTRQMRSQASINEILILLLNGSQLSKWKMHSATT